MDASYDAGYRDGESSRTADFLLGFLEAETMDDLLAYFRSLTGDPALEWPDGKAAPRYEPQHAVMRDGQES